jgi:hypothetical protein
MLARDGDHRLQRDRHRPLRRLPPESCSPFPSRSRPAGPLTCAARSQGTFEVSIDGGTATAKNGASPDDYQVQMFGVWDLPAGAHNLTLTNVSPGPNATYVDLDWVVIQTGDGSNACVKRVARTDAR